MIETGEGSPHSKADQEVIIIQDGHTDKTVIQIEVSVDNKDEEVYTVPLLEA